MIRRILGVAALGITALLTDAATKPNTAGQGAFYSGLGDTRCCEIWHRWEFEKAQAKLRALA